MVKRVLFTLFMLVACAVAGSQVAKLDPTFKGTQFERYTCEDKFGRTITFYLSRSAGKPLPLILFIQGSGPQSIWLQRGSQIAGGLQNLLFAQASDKARVLAVEKPGVACFYQPAQPGVAEGAPQAFLEEQTLPRWAEANEAALRAACKLPDVDATKILALGHSEGALVAAKVAADMAEVTHVGILSGSGPSQLFDMALTVGDKEAYDTWAEIQKDPDSTTKFAWGHPYRRWSTFCATSTIEQLAKTKAKIFAAAGTEDKSVPFQSFEALRAALSARSADAHFDVVEGGDHSFSKQGEKNVDGFTRIFKDVLDWFT
jgi:dipeptidyl aminopeptidase/acylaminoacyl peptidase